MASNFTILNGLLRATLAAGETGILGTGTPLRIVTRAGSPGTSVHRVKVCPDGEVPNAVVANLAVQADGTGSQGSIVFVGPGCPLLLGGTVAAGDLLTVKSGAFAKAMTGNSCVVTAGCAGVTGDLIPAELLPITAP